MPGLVLETYFDYDSLIFSHSVELIIAGYYLLLSTSLLKDKPYIQAGGIILCLLSRYFLIVWLPLYFWTLFVKGEKKLALKVGGIALTGVLILYVFPFLLRDTSIIRQGLDHHNFNTEKNWTFEPWQDADGKPGILFRGVGLGGYMYEFGPGSTSDQMKYMKWTQLIICFSALVGLGVFIWKYRIKADMHLFMLGSLKLMLVLFYSLLVLPVLYYFFVPLCISFPILLAQFEHTIPLEHRHHE